MSLRIYVAGPSSRRASIAVLLVTLRAHGAVITFDWTARMMADQGRELTEADRKDIATLCRFGVADADVFWLLLDADKSEGAHAELGMAIIARDLVGSGITIVVSGPCGGTRVFPFEADRRFDDHESALAFVLGLVRDRAA